MQEILIQCQNLSVLLQSSFGQMNNAEGLWIAFIPMLILIELPLLLIIVAGILRWGHQQKNTIKPQRYPTVSCIITCYSEGKDVVTTFKSLINQLYPGHIEVIAVIDGASVNRETLNAARQFKDSLPPTVARSFIYLPKWKRGGRVSALNTGLSVAKGDITMALDGDTSFDNDMVSNATVHFSNPNVSAVAGMLRVRNLHQSLATRMQALEYVLSMQAGKTGLGAWNIVNNISGAFGIFRTRFIKTIGGWNTHTAEDLDLTLRIRAYTCRYDPFIIPFEPHAVGHTDVPDSYWALFRQRLRWDGDLFFIYIRKHWATLSPRLLGWKAYFFIVIYGVLQNILLPLLLVIYTFWLLYSYPLLLVLMIHLLLYVLYLGLSTLLMMFHIMLISERPKDDLKLALWLPLYPWHNMVMRYFSAFAMLYEIALRGHEESSMAPWWVIRRANRF